MSQSRLRVCMVAPLPPPLGGIAHWTVMLSRYAAGRKDVIFELIDISPRWREVHDLALWKRSSGGAAQLVRDSLRLRRCLRTRPHVVHLTAPGGLALLRDNLMSRLACRMGVPVVYHIRFGRIPEIARGNSWEAWNLKGTLQRVAAVIAIDAASEEAIHKWTPAANTVRIPNCIDLKSLPRDVATEAREPFVMFLGTRSPRRASASWSKPGQNCRRVAGD